MPKNRTRNSRGQRRPRRGGAPRGPPWEPITRLDRYELDRTFLHSTITAVAGANILQVLVLNPSTFPATLSTFFTSFDYCIMRSVRVTVIPRWNVNGQGSVTDEELPQIAMAPNYDDFLAPTSFDGVLGLGNCRFRRFTGPFGMNLHPRPLTTLPVTSGSPPFMALLPATTPINSFAFMAGSAVLFPMARLAIGSPSIPPTWPGGGHVDIYYRLKFTLFQRLG